MRRPAFLIAISISISIPVAALAAPPHACGPKDLGWKKIPDTFRGSLRELCGGCELKKGRTCGGREMALRCLFQPAEMSASKNAHPRMPGGPGSSAPGPYADLLARSCASDPTKNPPPPGVRVDWVTWDSVFCGKPSRRPLKPCP